MHEATAVLQGLCTAMLNQQLELNSQTLVAAISACSRLGSLHRGLAMHAIAASNQDWCNDKYVANTLVDMYAKCSCMEKASRLFHSLSDPDVVAWTVLTMGYAEKGEATLALELFSQMQCPPNSWTLVAALKACTGLASLARCMAVHAIAAQSDGYDFTTSSVFVASALVDTYAKCGSMPHACRAFHAVDHPNVVTWTALIAGYADTDAAAAAVDAFCRMRQYGCRPNCLTYAALVKACTRLGDLQAGMAAHASAPRVDVLVATSLMDLYGKFCTAMREAERLFDSLDEQHRDVLAWTSLLAGYARHGDAGSAFRLFDQMQKRRRYVAPNGVTFLCLLTACSHAGLVDRADELFRSMQPKHGISPALEHYNCVIDMLARATRLEEAVQLARSMPLRADDRTWMPILAGAAKCKNVELARLAFQFLVRLDPTNNAAYALMVAANAQ